MKKLARAQYANCRARPALRKRSGEHLEIVVRRRARGRLGLVARHELHVDLTLARHGVGHARAAGARRLAPEAGVLRNLSALPGQTVPSGAALFECFYGHLLLSGDGYLEAAGEVAAGGPRRWRWPENWACPG